MFVNCSSNTSKKKEPEIKITGTPKPVKPTPVGVASFLGTKVDVTDTNYEIKVTAITSKGMKAPSITVGETLIIEKSKNDEMHTKIKEMKSDDELLFSISSKKRMGQEPVLILLSIK